jgi:hypothetical protein
MSDEFDPFDSSQNSSPQAFHTGVRGERSVPFASGRTWAKVTIGLLAIEMLADLAVAGSTYLQIQLLHRAQSGVAMSRLEGSANVARQRVVRLARLAAYVVTGIAFLIWSFRGHRNLRSLDARYLEYSSGWAVWAWLLPVYSLVGPYLLMAEVWRESNPAETPGRPAGLPRPRTPPGGCSSS